MTDKKSRISFVLQALFPNFGYNRKPFENNGSSEDWEKSGFLLRQAAAPALLACYHRDARKPSEATFMLSSAWLATARPLDALLAKNYNQTLKELKYHFSEQRAMVLVCKLEKYMMQLVQIMHKVVELTIRYENHRIGKNN